MSYMVPCRFMCKVVINRYISQMFLLGLLIGNRVAAKLVLLAVTFCRAVLS